MFCLFYKLSPFLCHSLFLVCKTQRTLSVAHRAIRVSLDMLTWHSAVDDIKPHTALNSSVLCRLIILAEDT